MSAEDKKKLGILGGLFGAFLILVFFMYVLPSMRKGGGPEEPPDSQQMASETGAAGAPGAAPEGGAPAGEAAPGAAPGPSAAPAGGADAGPPAEMMPGGAGGAPMGGGGEPGMGAGGAGGGPAAPAAGAAQTDRAKGEPYFGWRADPFSPIGVGLGDLSEAAGRRRTYPPVPASGRVETIGTLPAVPTFRSGPAAVPRNLGAVLPEEELKKVGDKRMAGLLVNDSVWAVLEVGTGTAESTSYVVKPGDTVENIRVQRIERDKIVIRDAENKLKEVELRKAPPKTTGQGGEGMGMGMEGMPGMDPGMAGMQGMGGMGQPPAMMQGMQPQNQPGARQPRAGGARGARPAPRR